MGGNQARQQALLNLDVDSDYSLTLRANVVANLPDAVEEVMIPDVFGIGLAPNFNDPHAGDRAVRQAMAHVINRDLARANSYPRVKTAPAVATGIPSAYQETWLGDTMSDFETYGQASSNTDQAASILRSGGYSKSGGTWQDSQGRTVSVPITTPSGWPDWTLAVQSVVDQLNSFGFDSAVQTTGSYFSDISNPDSFTFMANTWLHGGPSPYPYYALLHQLHEPQLHACSTAYPGYTEQYGGSSASISIDQATPNSGSTEVDVAARLDELAVTTDEQTETEPIQDLAWGANQDLPRIPILEKSLQQWLTTDNWNVPEPANEDPDANVSWAPTHLPRVGKMNYSGN
jgi:peptide/nickel transport system substrate-binding protein